MHQDPAERRLQRAAATAVKARMPGIRSLHSPGPTRVPDAVPHAMQRPMMDLADPRVGALIGAREDGMRALLGTPPLAHLAGLAAALGLIDEEGLTNVHERHTRLAGAVHAALARWADAGALKPYCRVPAARLSSVTAIEVRAGIDPEALRMVARERFQVSIAGGLGPLAARVSRIGHLGDMNEAASLGALGGVEAAMVVQGVPFGAGGVAAAANFLVEATGGGAGSPT